MRYYSTQRPLGPGTYPRQNGGETITIFVSPVYCEEIGRETWGYIDYKEPITPEQAACYELIPGTSTWYPITVSSCKHGGGIRAFSGQIVKAAQRPEDKDGDTKNMQFKTRYFHTWQGVSLGQLRACLQTWVCGSLRTLPE